MARPKTRPPLDPDLADLPREARWREWMGRADAVIFASPAPVTREALSRLVGPDCRLDELIADISQGITLEPGDTVSVVGTAEQREWRLLIVLDQTENLLVTAVAHLQPAARTELSRLFGKEVSRDTIARLKRLDLVGSGSRVPQIAAHLRDHAHLPVRVRLRGLTRPAGQ